jgi:acetylornithine/succinyldiaminopimelate/putrescine aminotransferase
MQAACAVLEVLDADFLSDMRSRSAVLFAELDGLKQKHEAIIEIRGNGFLIGLVLADYLTPLDVMAACRAHHMLVVPAAANTVRLLPPLNVSTEDIYHAVAVLDTVLSACEEKAGHNHD